MFYSVQIINVIYQLNNIVNCRTYSFSLNIVYILLSSILNFVQADKSSIVDEAVSYIKTLQQTLRKLQKQKLERLQGVASFGFEASAAITPQNKLAIVAHDRQQESSSNLLGANSTDATNNSSNLLSVSPTYPVIFQTWTSSNVVLNICGDEAHISICSPKKPGMFSTICYLLEKHKIEVISAQVSSDLTRRMYMIQAHVSVIKFSLKIVIALIFI